MNLLLTCTDLEETKAFYSEILEFQVSDSAEGTCTVQKAGGTIVFTDGDLWEGHPHCTGTIYFFLPNVDEYREAIKHKAIIRWPLENQSYGTREFGIKDWRLLSESNSALLTDSITSPLRVQRGATKRGR